jgi:tetratricopeptide (TPR) repeat protein
VAKIKNIRQKRPGKKFRIPSSVMQWGIVGVVAVVLVALVVGALSRPPAEPAPIPLLSTVKTDLISVTRMLGDVTLDSTTHAWLQENLGARLVGPDSLFAQRRWYDALTALSRMLRGATRPESAAIKAYMGFCYYDADNLDRSLQALRKSLTADSNPTGVTSRLQFSIGWMFQSRGYQDSAIAYYSRVRRGAPDSARLLDAEAANNAGVAYEVLKDTSAAGTAYREATALLDTIEYPRESKTIRENLARLASGR